MENELPQEPEPCYYGPPPWFEKEIKPTLPKPTLAKRILPKPTLAKRILRVVIKVLTMKWYLKVIRSYAQFSGRARRQEYWMFVLFNLIFACAAMVLDNVLGLSFDGIGYGIIYLLYALAVLIPGLAVAVRRLHDIGKSGWMMLVSLIPLIGGIWLLILLATDGQQEANQYGSNPKNLF